MSKSEGMDYGRWYGKWTASFRSRPRALAVLRGYNQLATACMVLVYAGLLGSQWWQGGLAAVLPILFVPVAGFFLVSLLRRLFNRPRPYETWNLVPLIARDKSGESMPSRHVFSATVIAMCVLHVHIWLGLLLLVLSAGLAVTRVLGGVHYPTDVAVGFLLGVACGALLFLG